MLKLVYMDARFFFEVTRNAQYNNYERVLGSCNYCEFNHPMGFSRANGSRRHNTGIGKILDKNTSYKITDNKATWRPGELTSESQAVVNQYLYIIY